MHTVVFARLDTHVPCAQGIDATFGRFEPDTLFKHHQRLVALADEPVVGFPDAGGVGRDVDAGPEGWTGVFVAAGRIQVGGALETVVEDAVEPVQRGLDVKVVPEAVAEYEGVGFLGFLRREEMLEPSDFCGVEREAEHHFNDQVDGLGAGEGVWVVFEDRGRTEDALD